jgi:hypothetical protein
VAASESQGANSAASRVAADKGVLKALTTVASKIPGAPAIYRNTGRVNLDTLKFHVDGQAYRARDLIDPLRALVALHGLPMRE